MCVDYKQIHNLHEGLEHPGILISTGGPRTKPNPTDIKGGLYSLIVDCMFYRCHCVPNFTVLLVFCVLSLMLREVC